MGGGGSTYDYGFRIYNPQIAKFLSVDPLTKSYPFYTPYQFASNTPIMASDLDGAESEVRVYGNGGDKDPTQVIINAKEIRRFMKANGAGYSGDANDILLYTPGKYAPSMSTESVAGSLPTLREQLKGSEYINKGEVTVKEVPSTVGGYGKGPFANSDMPEWTQEGEKGARAYVTELDKGGKSLKYAGMLLSETAIGAPLGVPLVAIGQIMETGADGMKFSINYATNKTSQNGAFVTGEVVGEALDHLTPKNLFSNVVREYAKDYVKDNVENSYNKAESQK